MGVSQASKVEEQSRRGGKTVVTEIVDATDLKFYRAEGYHQQYLAKKGQSAEKGCTTRIRCYG